MKAPDWKNCTEEELWQYVASHLAKNDIDTVLVGGAVVSIYSHGAYRSGDLDIVVQTLMTKKLPKLMEEIGFVRDQGRHYRHPQCKHLFIDFASPPPAIGDDTQITPDKLEVDGVKIGIYSPTDCIRDRLASYLHFKAADCLDQAVLVALKHPFSPKKIQDWCKAEGAPQVFDDFTLALREAVAKQQSKK